MKTRRAPAADESATRGVSPPRPGQGLRPLVLYTSPSTVTIENSDSRAKRRLSHEGAIEGGHGGLAEDVFFCREAQSTTTASGGTLGHSTAVARGGRGSASGLR
jgi:hypothetical protein